MLALLTLALLTEAPRSVPLLLAAAVVLTGLVATLSRAGLLALAVGVLVLGALLGPCLLLRSGAAPVLGAAVAAIGLVPAMTARTPHPAAAFLALVAGLGISAALPAIRLPRAAVNGLAHAGFDFVWHIPAIPLLAAALVGLASPEVPARLTQPAGETPGEESA